MKILVFSQYYYPEQFLINDITKELAKRGNTVTVITGLPNYPSGVIPDEYKRKNRKEEIIDGVKIHRCPILPRGKGKLLLLLNYLSYVWSAGRTAKHIGNDFDLVFSYQVTPILQVLPAIRYCKKNRKPLLLYNLDLAPMCGGQLLKYLRLSTAIYSHFSKRIMNAADMVAVTSKSFIEYNHRINKVPLEKLVYLPQHAPDAFLDLDMWSEDNGVADFLFAGSVSGGVSFDTIIKAAEEIAGEFPFQIHVVGDGSKLEHVRKQVAAKNLKDCFIFYGRHPLEEMPFYFKKADALLITLRAGQITVPGKLQTYMATGKPILGALDGSGFEMIQEAECGSCVRADDCSGLAGLMREFAFHPEKYRNCGEKARRYFSNNFRMNIFIHHFTKIMESVAKTHGEENNDSIKRTEISESN